MSESSHPVVNLLGRSRYEILADGHVAGFSEYRLRGDHIVFVHTEIDGDHAGQGLGGVLARRVLEDAKARALTIVPICPVIAGWLRRNPAFDGTVDWDAATAATPASPATPATPPTLRRSGS